MKRNVFFLVAIISIIGIISCTNEFADDYTNNQNPINVLRAEQKANYYADLIINSYSNGTRSSGKLKPNFHPSYGGSYINHNGKLVVMIANKDNEYKKYIQTLVGPENVIFKFCDNSYNSLISVLDSLNSYKFNSCKSSDYSNFRHFGLRTIENKIEVYLDEYSENKIQEFKNKINNSNVIIFSKSEGELELQSDLNPGSSVDVPRSDGKYNGGSIGYRAMDIGGTKGFVVSGHLISTGQTLYQGSTAIGYCLDSRRVNGVDAAFIEPFANFTPTNNIAGFYGTLSTTISNPQVGTSITKYGRSTGATSGTILSTNDTFDLRRQGGPIHTDLVRTNYNAADGDSGGIVFTSFDKKTLGIHVGMDLTTKYTYYSKASNINNLLGLARY